MVSISMSKKNNPTTQQDNTSTPITNTSADRDKAIIDQLQRRVGWLEDRLWYACEHLYKIGYEKDGATFVERFGVDANAARTILNQIGKWQRTSFSNPTAQQLPPRTAQPPKRVDAGQPKQVLWSKDPSFRGVL